MVPESNNNKKPAKENSKLSKLQYDDETVI